MGAEEQQEADQKPRSNPTSTPTSGAGTLTESQFLSWKRQKLQQPQFQLNNNYFQPHKHVKTEQDSKFSNATAAANDAAASTRKADASIKRAEDIAAGTVQMNGRELFLHEPWVFDNTLY